MSNLTSILPPFERYAFPLLSADGSETTHVVDVGRSWGHDVDFDMDVIVCGRPPLRSVRGVGQALQNARGRSRFKRRLQVEPPAGYRLDHFQELVPPGAGIGVMAGVRARLLGGAVARLVRGSSPSLLDKLREAAGDRGQGSAYHAPGDGSAVARIDRQDGPAFLRLGWRDAGIDLDRIARALQLLEGSSVRHSPRLLQRGELQRVSWVAESVLPGSRPASITPRLVEQVAGFCSDLPRASGPPSAPREELDLLQQTFPQWESAFDRALHEIEVVEEGVTGVMRHGDFWRGNLLVQHGELTGVIDWDAWHHAGFPGSDLVHFCLGETKRGARSRQLGEIWLDGSWLRGPFASVLRSYWEAMEIHPSNEIVRAAGLAWWTCWVAQSVVRHPPRARDARWVAGNVRCVVDQLESASV